ncbi:MAG: hypothetical protein ACKVU4_09135 [Phycisphaerales bacterium]
MPALAEMAAAAAVASVAGAAGGPAFAGTWALAESWRPFLDPLDLHAAWWLFLIPLAFGISVTYKAVRLPTLDRYWRGVAAMTAQIVGAMILLGIASYLFVGHVMPAIVPMTE